MYLYRSSCSSKFWRVCMCVVTHFADRAGGRTLYVTLGDSYIRIDVFMA